MLPSFSQSPIGARPAEEGYPFIKYYTPQVYNASSVNWTITQDKRGIMYFGNGTGILEFDGISWRKIEVPNSANVRSLAIDDNGTIYVCASNDFGYLEPDSMGQLKYQSLMPHLAKRYQNYGEMWDVSTSSKAAYFKTKDKIFKWDGNHITVIDSVFAYRLYKIKDTIYSRNNKVGLMLIEGDSLKLMPDGGFFASIGVYNMLPYSDPASGKKDKILVATNFEGLYLHDGQTFSPFKTEVDSFLFENQIYNSCITAGGNYAFATQRGGVVIIDTRGRLVRFINETSGLPTNVIYDVFSDQQDRLWMASLYGIVYCEAASPFTIFQNRGSLRSMSNSVIRFNGTLYVANEFGVLTFSDEQLSFDLIEGSNKPAYKLFSTNGVLLAGTNWGVAPIEYKTLGTFMIHHTVQVLVGSKVFPGRVYVGYRDGFAVLEKQKDNQYHIIFEKETDDEVLSLVEEADGSIWFGGYFYGLFHITGDLENLSTGSDKDLVYTYYKSLNELPGNMWTPYDIQDKMLLSTEEGIFSFDNASKKFMPDSTLGTVLSDPQNSIVLIEKGIKNDLWVVAEINGIHDLGKATLQQDGTYYWNPLPEFRRLDLRTVNAIYSDYNPELRKEILWISTNEALVRYDPGKELSITRTHSTLIRKISIHNDSLIYGGYLNQRSIQNNRTLSHAQDEISFEFSATSYDKPDASQYQYFLQGNDAGWSRWTTETKKEYTNLASGEYQFRVRSKNVYGIAGEEDRFSFTILPPFYLTWWAYLFYALLLILSVFTADRIQRRKLISRERERAKLREAELVKKQAEELKTVDRLVRGINKAGNLDALFNSLVEKTIAYIPQAEKAVLFLLDHKENIFRVAYTSGYNLTELDQVTFLPDELKKRYMQNSEEVEKGIYIIANTEKLPGDEKLAGYKKAKSILVMAVEWENRLEAYVVFDNFSTKNAFNPSTARILKKFREHAVSAISKARTLKIVQQKNEKIIKTQKQLLIQEKLASLGQLTAGTAHEIKNPLNFVKNFSDLSVELLEDLRSELEDQKDKIDLSTWSNIEDNLVTLEGNSRRISEHGKRADSIVHSMLQHSRGKTGERRKADINAMLDENINLVYHGLRAQSSEFNIAIEREFDPSIKQVDVIPQDISRVFLNILQNACYAATIRKSNKQHINLPEQSAMADKKPAELSSKNEVPVVKVRTKNLVDKIEISIWDNGPGIPEEVRDKIFTPFFSTKPTGKGTGLGLSIAYDIVVKEHGGDIHFESKNGEYTNFIIILPDEDIQLPE